MFQAFDLTVDVPKCLDCGVEPCKKGTSSNCYSHFYHHHRPRWLQYKNEDGALSDAGDAALQTIKEQLAAAAATSAASLTTKTLRIQGDAKTAMDRVTSEWIVDDDMAKGAASTPAYKKKMKIATQGVLQLLVCYSNLNFVLTLPFCTFPAGAYEGCDMRNVGANNVVANMSEEGVEVCAKYLA